MSISPERARGPQQPDLELGPLLSKGGLGSCGPEPPVKGFQADGLRQTVRTDNGPMKAPAGFSISGFLRGFKAGDVVEIDGPMWADGAGRIQRLTHDHLKLDYNVKGEGKGTIEVKRLDGNHYEMSFNGEKLNTRYSWNGKSVVLTDENNPKRRFELTMEKGNLNLNPIGFDCPGTFDISVRK